MQHSTLISVLTTLLALTTSAFAAPVAEANPPASAVTTVHSYAMIGVDTTTVNDKTSTFVWSTDVTKTVVVNPTAVPDTSDQVGVQMGKPGKRSSLEVRKPVIESERHVARRGGQDDNGRVTRTYTDKHGIHTVTVGGASTHPPVQPPTHIRRHDDHGGPDGPDSPHGPEGPEGQVKPTGLSDDPTMWNHPGSEGIFPEGSVTITSVAANPAAPTNSVHPGSKRDKVNGAATTQTVNFSTYDWSWKA
ncbi:hypothetical protein FFLO_01512 [Filobasidium floriforme]|uniref:Uncharacterized protein n=1 Tax=Filobasidium floriforme TaxID=5210 RepID=A0A8K0JRD1_9TREE|nr:uncharacterized protein HD553DRAFT_360517 [Filobasidium floriforme]KAG7563080.1 hypothetical protein FFLO_01512 [Filobasidium floriforme]KAH8089637.1 hypothetical protein HD553DRAFT_360517 [Filobasidium floriforme]